MSSLRFERNLGFLSGDEQDKLMDSRVAIAGAGGDGGMLAVQLARMGVGSMRLADPDPFEIENINRQAVCTDATIGTNKAVAVADYIQSINPDINLEIYDKGITIDNAASFVAGADLLIDETEYTMQHLAVLLAREARDNNVPNMTALNIAFSGLVTTYTADGSILEKRLGFSEDTPIDKIEGTPAELDRWLPYLPKYGDLEVLKKIATGEKSAPSVAPGVALAAGVGATQAFLNLVGHSNRRPAPVTAPKALLIDAMTGVAKEIRYSRLSHYKHLGVMALRSALNRNPETSY